MKNLQKGFIVPLLLAIIAVLVIGGGVYIYNNKKVETPVLPEDTTSQTNTQTNNSNSINISSWKTYTNTKYGFEIKLPVDWQAHITSVSGTETEISFDSPENYKILDQAKRENLYANPDYIGPDSNIVFGDLQKYSLETGEPLYTTSLEEFLNKESPNNYSKINFAGQTAFINKVTVASKYMRSRDIILFERNDNLYQILVTSKVGMDSQLKDKILFTFKFTK